MGGLPLIWGATALEHERAYPADGQVAAPAVLMTRAVTVRAPVPVTWRRLCQLAIAPYSYDWIDNRGRRSPRELTEGADRLDLGQRIMQIFTLVSLEDGHQMTLRTNAGGDRFIGPVAATYAVEPGPLGSSLDSPQGSLVGSRLVCRVAAHAPGRAARVRAYGLAWGDLVMMRKQLRTLGDLAERDALV